MSHFGTNQEQLRPELVSIRQIQVNIPQALWLPLPDRAWRRRLKCTAAFHLLIGFSWAFFRKTIVWDEASVSSHFAQTGVNSSQKGERHSNMWCGGLLPGGQQGSQKLQTQVTQRSYLPFTGCLPSLRKMKIKANSMENLHPRILRGKTFSPYLTNSGEITCRIKGWKVMENMLKISTITAVTQ